MKHESPKQPKLFPTPFEQNLDPNNRWVVLSKNIPWDTICSIYKNNLKSGKGSGNEVAPRIAIGSLIIKHKLDISDREVVEQIKENIYLQYFIGLSSFSTEAPFDASSLVHFRSRFNWEQIQEFIERLAVTMEEEQKKNDETIENNEDNKDQQKGDDELNGKESEATITTEATIETNENKGFMIIDSTVMPQNIAFPTDTKLLNSAREKSEEILDSITKNSGIKKPRTYRHVADNAYKGFSMKRKPSAKAVKKQVKKSLQYLKRNLKYIDTILDEYVGEWEEILSKSLYCSMLIIKEIYRQQLEMYEQKKNRCDHRIVNISQPHVRPIKRGKSRAQTEFGAKVCSFIDHHNAKHIQKIGWDATHDGEDLQPAAERFKSIYGYYPKEIKADSQYRTRANRTWCNKNGIKLSGRGPGRPKANAVKEKEVPGERNAIEGLFGHLKQHHGLQKVGAKLKQTSEAWIAFAFLVVNYCSLFLLAFFAVIFTVTMSLNDKIKAFLSSIRYVFQLDDFYRRTNGFTSHSYV